MVAQVSNTLVDVPRSRSMERQAPSGLTRQERRTSSGLPSGLLLTGLAVLGLGALAWYFLGPDLRRYLKIHNM